MTSLVVQSDSLNDKPVANILAADSFTRENFVNPALLYLSELGSKEGRRTMRSKLNRVAVLVGAKSIETCDWSKMRPQSVHAVLLRLEQENLSASTINNYLAALKGVAFQAWKESLMSSETLQRIRAIKSRRSSRLPKGRCLSMEESARLLACNRGKSAVVDVRDKAVLTLMLGCGLRRSEVCGLSLDDFDREERSIRLVGKGNKERTVYLPGEAYECLLEWLEFRGARSGPIFTRIFRGGHLLTEKRLSESAITLILKERLSIAGQKNATPHDLRRTFATRLIEDGNDLVKVQRAMGHANVQTTARYDRRGEKDQKEMALNVRIKLCRMLLKRSCARSTFPKALFKTNDRCAGTLCGR